MQLFYSPGASSLAPHIACCEAGIPVDLVRVDLEAETVAATGEAYASINPMRKVPALRLDDRVVLTETSAVLQYLADLAPGSVLSPLPNTVARYKMLEAMSFIATELHKGFSPMFDPELPGAYKQRLLADARPFLRMAALVEPGPYVLGEHFSVADAHLFTILRLGKHAGLDFSPWPSVERFMERVAKRPSVVQAMRAEGVLEG